MKSHVVRFLNLIFIFSYLTGNSVIFQVLLCAFFWLNEWRKHKVDFYYLTEDRWSFYWILWNYILFDFRIHWTNIDLQSLFKENFTFMKNRQAVCHTVFRLQNVLQSNFANGKTNKKTENVCTNSININSIKGLWTRT